MLSQVKQSESLETLETDEVDFLSPDDVQYRVSASRSLAVARAANSTVDFLRSGGAVDMQQPDAAKVVSELFCFGGGMSHDASTRVSERLSVPRQRIFKSQKLLASAAFCIHLSDLVQVITSMCNDVDRAKGRCHVFTLFARFDESPMKMAVLDSYDLWEVLSEDWMRELFEETAEALTTLRRHDVGVVKMLNVEFVITILVSISGQYFHFHFYPKMPLLGMGRTTAECFFISLKKLILALGVQEVMGRFLRKIFAATTDADGAVAKAIRALGVDGMFDAIMHLTDVVHRYCGIREAALSLPGSGITAVRHTVLSLRGGNHLKLFRLACQMVLLKRLHIVRDRLPVYANRCMNERRLKACFPDQQKLVCADLNLALTVLAGDWDKSDVFETFPPPSETDAQRKRLIIFDVVDAMVGSGPTGFPSRNFVRAEQAPQWILRLELVHRLFSQAYWLFLYLLHEAGKGKPPPELKLGDDDVSGMRVAPAEVLAPGLEADAEDHENELPAEGEASSADEAPGQDPIAIERARQKSYQRTVRRWHFALHLNFCHVVVELHALS